MKEIKLDTPVTCFACGWVMDTGENIGDSQAPQKVGDMAVCGNCGVIGVCTGPSQWREPTLNELLDLSEAARKIVYECADQVQASYRQRCLKESQ